jgi:predicted PurR-regulated permease PerM
MERSTEKNININITPGSIFKGIGIVLLLWFLYFIKDLVLVVLVAVVLASGLEPLILWLNKHKIKRVLAAIISYLGIAGVFFGFIFFFVPPVLDEASSFLNELPKYLESTPLWNPLNISHENIQASKAVTETLSLGIDSSGQLVRDMTDGKTEVFGLKELISSIQDVTSDVSSGMIKAVSAIFGGLLSFILIVVLSFYFVVQEDGVAHFLRLISPLKSEKYIIDLWRRSQRKIAQWIQGQLLLGIIVAVLVYLGLTILGVKNALLLAVLAGLLEIIPIFGPILASIPAIIMGFVGGGLTLSLLVASLYIIIQQFENHLIYPLVVKKVVGVSPVLVILALIVGGKLAGFLGVVLSVPMISALMEFVDDIEKKKSLFWREKAEGTEQSK